MGKIKWEALDLFFKFFKDLKAVNFYIKAGHLISLNFDVTFLGDAAFLCTFSIRVTKNIVNVQVIY